MCSSTLSMLHIIASTSGGLIHKVYRLSFILRPLCVFFFLPRSKLLVAGVVSVKLWDHSCMLSRSVLCGSPFLVLMALYKARASGRSVPPLQGTAFNSHHATGRMACSLCGFMTWQSVIDYDLTATRIQILQERSLIAKAVRSLPLKSYIYCWVSHVFLVHNFGHKTCI